MEKVLTKMVGVENSQNIDVYIKHGGYQALPKALKMTPDELIQMMKDAGVRGRGGAGFPTGMKWSFLPKDNPKPRYLLCNADESEPGTFKDRVLMEDDPHQVIEGLVISSFAIQANTCYIYIRGEYVKGALTLRKAIDEAYAKGYLGKNILGSGFNLDITVHRGAGAYICGEETSLLESLEGKRGEVRPKPPLPAHEGLFGKPTVVNNVISLATIPIILEKGGKHYANFGRGRSLGTMPFQLGGNIKYGGLVEKAFGLTLRQLIEDFGGGTATGKPVRAVQVGGPLGAYFPASLLDTPLDIEDFAKAGGMVGHGGVVVFDTSVNMAKMARFAMEFCSVESCGKCTPCRIGSVRGMETIDRIVQAKTQPEREKQLVILKDLCETMESASLCAMGGLTPLPVMSAVQHFKGDFQ